MKKQIILLVLSFAIAHIAMGQQKAVLRYEDKIRIREAMTIAGKYGETIWEGLNKVPFAIILVTDSFEFLINHPYPSDDFKLLGKDDILKADVYYRNTQFPTTWLATFPAVNGLSCIVVGTPENTGLNSSSWIVTLLHEHFHQYQNTYPDYFTSVAALDLANGDETGMWMLNYPFPYDNKMIVQQYEILTAALYKAVFSANSKDFDKHLKQYFVEKAALKKTLSKNDYAYFSFQVWQEGLARHTEYNFLRKLANYVPSDEVTALEDFVHFTVLQTNMFENETNNLLNLELATGKRICFYAIGFGEGILLDKANKQWRKDYLTQKFFTENYIKK